MKEIQEKGIIETIVNMITRIFNLEVLAPKFNSIIKENYSKGLERSEVQFDMNFVTKQENLQMLQETMMSNIENQGMEIAHKVKGELQRWKLNEEDLSAARNRIKEAMKKNTWDYKVKRVIRTETNRANNWGALDGAKQSGLNLKKYLDVIMDDDTSDICKKEHKKYGDKEKAIPIDEPFIVKFKNKTYTAQAPPFHPNCRTVVRFVRVEE